MKLLTAFILSILIYNPAFAKGNKPCSGKKGGVKHCTSDQKFMCKDGSISGSKKKCLV